MDAWVDCTDPLIIEEVTGDPLAADGVCEAIAAASEVLTVLTGYRGHAAGVATQEYIVGGARVTRLATAYRPVLEVLSVESVGGACTTGTDVTSQFCVFGGYIRRSGESAPTYVDAVLHNYCTYCGHRHEKLRLTYSFGSTVGAAGRRAALTLSRQLWLSQHPDSGECILPERVTSVTREGLSYSFLDPMTFLDQGRTGIPPVDTYLSVVNATKAKVPAAVYIPEAPPGVVI